MEHFNKEEFGRLTCELVEHGNNHSLLYRDEITISNIYAKDVTTIEQNELFLEIKKDSRCEHVLFILASKRSAVRQVTRTVTPFEKQSCADLIREMLLEYQKCDQC